MGDRIMEPGLAQTRYCNWNHPEIQRVASALASSGSDPMTTAVSTFHFVRDRIIFGFDRYRRRASDILMQGYGVCWNKALLLVALLRCNGIRANFGSIAVARTFIKPAIGAWYRLANHPFHHCVALVRLDGRWIIADAVLDRVSYEAFYQSRNVSWGIGWDGTQDVRLYREWVQEDVVHHPDIDAALDRRVGNLELPGIAARLGYWIVNRMVWKRAGTTPVAMARVGHFK